jgi:K+-transporting ATPase KdpF subunit
MKKVINSVALFSGVTTVNEIAASKAGYIIGLVVAFLVLCYLIYVLIKPEKF